MIYQGAEEARVRFKIFGILGCVLFLGSLSSSLAANSNSVKVKVLFTYDNTKLRMKLYEVQPAFQYSIARTVITSDLKSAPLLKEINADIDFPPGEDEKTFALVVENNENFTKYFYAVPHTFHPGSSSLGVLFECLCNRHVYTVPAKYFWYRIVRLKLDRSDPNLKGLKSITLDHQFVEVSEKDVQAKYKTLLYEQDEDRKKRGRQ